LREPLNKGESKSFNDVSSSNPEKLIILSFLSAGVFVLLLGFLTVWQHDAAMAGMMGHMMGSVSWMTWWMGLPLFATAATLLTIPLVIYFSGRLTAVSVAGLTEDEMKVVNYLTRNGGSAKQNEIARELGISRLKVHRLVSSLKRRGIVEVIPQGRTNIVALKKSAKAT